MIEIVKVDEPLTLDDYGAIAHLARNVQELRQEAAILIPQLRGRRLWMVNSTAVGGGVAEMLPRLVSLLNELGLPTQWAVIHSDKAEFFHLTKRLHNLIHGYGDPNLSDADRELYEQVNRENADELSEHVTRNDIVAIHDPQPMPLGAFLKKQLDVPTIWRCHIGLDETLEQNLAAWKFLKPYAAGYDHAIFSAPEYIPGYFAGRATVIHPAIDPLSHKNRHLSPVKMTGILCDAGLAKAHSPTLTGLFKHQAQRLPSDGSFAPATQPDEIGLLYRPLVTQISRWDRLKGWLPLMKAFVKLKSFADDPKQTRAQYHRRRLKIVRLVLAGPDPDSIQDDPEALEVLEELCENYVKLPPEVSRDIAILSLPMQSRKENALMVNALQACSSVVVQNSLREGFGLTATEAMYKRVAVLGTQACGLRHQIRHQVDGYLVRNPEDADEVAEALNELLANPKEREMFARNAQKHAHDKFLVFTQARRWLEVLAETLSR